MKVHGVCEGPSAHKLALVVEALPQKLSSANINAGKKKQEDGVQGHFLSLPLERRLQMVLGVLLSNVASPVPPRLSLSDCYPVFHAHDSSITGMQHAA